VQSHDLRVAEKGVDKYIEVTKASLHLDKTLECFTHKYMGSGVLRLGRDLAYL
jgi:hypothetical protein